MFIYTVVVLAIVILSSVVVTYVLHKNNMLGMNTVLSLLISSIAVIALSLVFPFFLNALIDFPSGANASMSGVGVFTAALITFIIYIFLIFLFAVFLSSFLSNVKVKDFSSVLKIGFLSRILNLSHRQMGVTAQGVIENNSEIINQDNTDEASSIQQTISNEEYPQSQQQPGLEGEIVKDKNILEKSVDSEQNIDTIGLETVDDSSIESFGVELDEATSDEIQDMDTAVDETAAAGGDLEEIVDIETAAVEDGAVSESESIVDELVEIPDMIESIPADLVIEEAVFSSEDKIETDDPGQVHHVLDEDSSIEDYIDEAFRLKENGDIEGAILHYMYALDKKPADDLVFWIILDTCVLYKELGQAELARDILQGYVEKYGHIMDVSVRVEIEKNLL